MLRIFRIRNKWNGEKAHPPPPSSKNECAAQSFHAFTVCHDCRFQWWAQLWAVVSCVQERINAFVIFAIDQEFVLLLLLLLLDDAPCSFFRLAMAIRWRVILKIMMAHLPSPSTLMGVGECVWNIPSEISAFQRFIFHVVGERKERMMGVGREKKQELSHSDMLRTLMTC